MAIAIGIFFIMVILAGRVYLTDLDDDYFIKYQEDGLEMTLTLWLLRNDSKNIPVQTNPPEEPGPSYASGRKYIQREYIAPESQVVLQLRNARPLMIDGESPPSKAELRVEVWHAKVPSHRPIIVVGPNSNSTRTTEIYLDDVQVIKVFEDEIDVDATFGKSVFSSGYAGSLKLDIFDFTGEDDFWKIRVYDSISGEDQSFNGMALFKVRINLAFELENGSSLETGWIETQFFAIDLVENGS